MTIQVHQISISGGGVPKQAVEQVEITAQGLTGDKHADMQHHGGEDRAVCLFSLEVIEALQAEGHAVAPGSAGENLTLSGLSQPDWANLTPGQRLKIGPDVTLEITKYTAPCSTIASFFVEGNSNRISQKTHPGWSRLYARVVTPGEVKTGDIVTVTASDGATL